MFLFLLVQHASAEEIDPIPYKGTYKYNEEGFTGQLVLSPPDLSTKAMSVVINTYRDDNGNMCAFEGLCITKNRELICTEGELQKKELDNYVKITLNQDALTVTDSYHVSCGAGAFLTGNYINEATIQNANSDCIDQTGEPHTLIGKIVSLFLENNAAFIVAEANNQKYELPITADKQIETREMIGDIVSITYVDKQYWDEHDELCAHTAHILEIKPLQSALQEPVERILGSGNLEGTLLDVGEEAGFCYLEIQESYGKSYLPIDCGEMSSYVSLRGKDVSIAFTVLQYYYEPDEVWLKDFKIEKINEW
jgi:hypothetical protein